MKTLIPTTFRLLLDIMLSSYTTEHSLSSLGQAEIWGRKGTNKAPENVQNERASLWRKA